MSGPYALAPLATPYYGNVNLGATVFTPCWQPATRRPTATLRAQPSDMFEAAHATGIEQLLPSATLPRWWLQGKLPQTQLFSSTPPAPGFAAINAADPAAWPWRCCSPGLWQQQPGQEQRPPGLLPQDAAANPDGRAHATTGAQAAALQHPLRKAFKANDLRNWKPQRPVLPCGGNADLTVFCSANTALG